MTASDTWPELQDCESQVDDPDELYLRQISSRNVSDGEVNGLAFRCTDADNGKLSGVRSSKQSAEGAYLSFPGLSVGTWGVSIDEVAEIDLRVVDDETCPDAQRPKGHAYLDMRRLEGKAAREMRDFRRTQLAYLAMQRGCLYAD